MDAGVLRIQTFDTLQLILVNGLSRCVECHRAARTKALRKAWLIKNQKSFSLAPVSNHTRSALAVKVIVGDSNFTQSAKINHSPSNTDPVALAMLLLLGRMLDTVS